MIIFCFLNFVKIHENHKTFPFIIVYSVVGLQFKILIFLNNLEMKKSLLLLLFTFLCFGQFVNAQCEIAENFDSYNNDDVPTDWTMINTTGVSQAYGKVTSNPSAPTPPKYFRMYNAAADSGELIFISPMNATTSDGNHRLKFYAQGNVESSLIVGTTNIGDGSGVFTTVLTIALTGLNNTDWVAHEVIIPAGTDQYIFFQHNLGSTFDQVNIDSVCLEPIPTCLEVTNVALANPTQTSLDLSWTESGTGEDNWEYVVQEVGGGEPTTNGTDYTSTDTNLLVTVDNLEIDTEYEAYVRANCGGGDYGAWIKSGNTFRTDCGEITSNYCEDWEGIADNTVPFCWSVVDEPAGGWAYVNYIVAYGKNMFELVFTTTTTGDIIAISPEAPFANDGTHRLRIQAGASSGSPEDILQIGTIDGSGNFVQFSSLTLTADRNAVYLVDLPNNGHSKYAFKHNGAVNKYIWINTVCIEDIPSCLEVTDVTATNVQYNSADISWNTSGSGETTWEYLVQESTLPAPEASTNGTEIGTNSVTVSLDQNTAYKAYVRAKCDVSDFGAWMASQEFTTTCDVNVAEYSDSFEGLNEDGQEVKPCWSIFDTTTGDFRTYASQNNILPTDGNLMLRMFFSASSTVDGLILSSPETSDLNTDKQIRFKMNKSASTTEGFNIIVGTMSDPLDASTFVILDDTTLNETSIVAETWTEFTIDFSNYDTSLNYSYIAFKPQHSGNGSNFKNIYMDEFTYEYAEPQGLNDEPTTAAVLIESDDFNCNNAITGDFVGATRTTNYPCTNPAYDGYKDLWYRFTPTESGKYAFSIESLTGEDVNMFIFEGSSVDLQPISSGCSTRYTAPILNGGETYFVSISSPEPNTQFSLCVSKFPEVPVNDEPSGAILLTESVDDTCNNGIDGYTASSTHSIDVDCGTDYGDVWYTFIPTQTANYTFRKTLFNGTAPTYVAVYSGTPGNLTRISEVCTTYLQRVDLTAGETYYVSVSSSDSSIPTYFTMCVYPSPPAPANDECSAGFELTVGADFETSYIIGNSTSSTRNVNDPDVDCEGLEFLEKGKDVWYTVTVPESGRLKLETKTNNDPYLDDMGLQAYSGICGSLTNLYCDADGGEGFFNYIELDNLEPGTEILVRAWGYAGRYGYFKIAAYDDSPTCNQPTDITVTDITDTSAMLNWTAPNPAPTGGYEYIVQLDNSGYPGASTGTQTSQTNVLVENLIQNTDYEVYVKSICSTNGSAWEGPILFTTDMTVGISEHNAASFKFYPNPVKDVLNVSCNGLIQQVTIYNLTGQKVMDTKLNSTSGELNMAHLATGLYLVEAQVDSEIVRFKVIVD